MPAAKMTQDNINARVQEIKDLLPNFENRQQFEAAHPLLHNWIRRERLTNLYREVFPPYPSGRKSHAVALSRCEVEKIIESGITRFNLRIKNRGHYAFFKRNNLLSRIPKSTGGSHIRNNEHGSATFYVIECQDATEHFYKFGITALDVETRFADDLKMPYNIETRLELVAKAPFIYSLEKWFSRQVNRFRYSPDIPFGGHTETFKCRPKFLNSLLAKLEV